MPNITAHSRYLLLSTLTMAAILAGCRSQTALQPGGDDNGTRDADEQTQRDPAQVRAELATVLEGDSEKLETFRSTKDLGKYLENLRKKNESQREVKSKSGLGTTAPGSAVVDASAAPPAEPASAAEGEADGDDSITNTQEAGVDEGGIVKTHGDHLVVLRRGRLFTVKVGDDALQPVSTIDVAPAKGHNSWYDEMLIKDDKIVVVGFSYQVGATELGLFNVDKQGRLTRHDTFFLRSNDYYSSRNYASRLLGDKLVFYMPYYLGWGFDAANPNLPGVAGWDTGRGKADDWDLVIDGNDIHKPIQPTTQPVLHTVVTCDLSNSRLDCDAQGIVGPAGRSFYVSSKAVYVWVHEGWSGAADHDETAPPAAVYRMPLDGGATGALRVWGAPVDQFSFKESSDGRLNVLVRADAKGDAMWSPEFAGGDIGMLRVPVEAFDRGVSTVSANAYTDLPEPSGENYYAFQNRFVGDYLLYGIGSGWGSAAQSSKGGVFAHPFAGGQTQEIALPHGVDRLEALGNDGVVVGSDGRNLHFTALDLSQRPTVGGAYVQRNSTQGELRSHGFFYKPQSADEGVLGLPIRRGNEPGSSHLVHGSAEILYLNVQDLNFRELGALSSNPRAGTDDQCVTSCVDWYGNARPIFYRSRVFALLGYELVEGRLSDRGLSEVNRVDMLDLVRGPQRRGPIWKAK